jgi:TPR repeat protein
MRGKAGTISLQWKVRMRLPLPFLLLAAFFLAAVPASSAQTVNPQSGAVCEQQPTDMDAIRSKAETGDASAEYELGRSMLSRRPTDSEFDSAMPWFRRSAEQGYAPAEYTYGSLFHEGRWKDPKQLVYWWTKAAEQRNVHAQLWLGVFYGQGQDGLKRDYVEALNWLSKAAKQGQTDAQVTLGQMYENGEGVPPDFQSAAYWYRKAADHTMDLGGAGQGAHRLAQLYEGGHATTQDYVFVYLSYAYTRDTDGMQDVAQKMNASQIADAQRRVRVWVTPRIPCPPTAATPLPAPSIR